MKIAPRALAGLCLAVVVAGGPMAGAQETPQAQQQGQRGQQAGSQDRRFWWRHPETIKEIGLTARQTEKIEHIWQARLPGIRELEKQLDVVRAEFDRLIKENKAEEQVIALQIDRVEALRSQINKSRHLMIYRMHQVLTPEQYQKLTQINERRRKESGRR